MDDRIERMALYQAPPASPRILELLVSTGFLADMSAGFIAKRSTASVRASLSHDEMPPIPHDESVWNDVFIAPDKAS